MKKKTAPAPKKKVYSKKIINYTMPPDVVEALEKVMKEEGLSVMTKAINMCILRHLTMREIIKREASESNQLNNENLEMRDTIEKFVQSIEKMKTY